MNTIRPLAQVQLAAGAGTVIYTVPGGAPNNQAIIKSLWICNATAAAHWVTLRYGTGALTAANSLMEQASIPANTSWYIDAADSLLTLVFGAAILGIADAASAIVITVSGEEIR